MPGQECARAIAMTGLSGVRIPNPGLMLAMVGLDLERRQERPDQLTHDDPLAQSMRSVELRTIGANGSTVVSVSALHS
jgi:hypothetical protein